ncbi:MAG: hypothetical protein LIO69_03620, partial [Oscillospiraceae bacterium]|nr:hypothetical protein [Oscillospiraceae bacterium]
NWYIYIIPHCLTKGEHFTSDAFMPLNVELHGSKLTLSHTYISNGDLMYDPAITFKIDKENETAIAMTFENSGLGKYENFEENPAGRADCESHVLDTWLPNIVKQGYSRSEFNREELESGIDDDTVGDNGKDGNSPSENTKKTFAEQIDAVLSGNGSRYNDLKVCDTPQILLDVGCKQLPMLYTQRHLELAIMPKNSKMHHHGLTIEQMKSIPEKLIEPVMIFDSISRKDSIIAVLNDVDSDNDPIVVTIQPNGKGTYELHTQDSNFVTSIYGRENFERFIQNTINADSVLFYDKQKSQELFSVLGLQFPKGLNNLDSNTIIHKSNNIVNTFSKKIKKKSKMYLNPMIQVRL